MSTDIISNEQREKNIGDNINFLAEITNIPTPTAMAKEIGVAPTTWHSFLKNPLSNSTAKTAFCNHFNITVRQLENENLSSLLSCKKLPLTEWSDSLDESMQECSILEMEDSSIFEKLQTVLPEDIPLYSEIQTQKIQIAEKSGLRYKSLLKRAKEKFDNNHLSEALELLNCAWWTMTAYDLKFIKESDLELYINLCTALKDNLGIKQLVDKLISTEFYNEKIVIVFSTLLELKFPELSQICYKAVLDNFNA